MPAPSVHQMAAISSWCHFSKSILKCGRVSLADQEGPEDMDPELWALMRNKADPAEPRLKILTLDEPVKGKSPAWSLRKGGDFTVYNATQNKTNVSHGVVILRSN